MNMLLLEIGGGIMSFAALLPFLTLRMFIKYYAALKEEKDMLESFMTLGITVLCICVLLGAVGFITFCFAL